MSVRLFGGWTLAKMYFEGVWRLLFEWRGIYFVHSDRTGAHDDSKTPAIKGLAALDVISQMPCPLRDSMWTNLYKVRKNVVTTVHVCCRAVGVGLFDPSSTALSS